MTERETFEAFWISRYKDEKVGRRALNDDDYGYVSRDWLFWQASRQQAMEEIQPILDRIKEHAEFNDPEADTKGGQLLMILGELECIRSLTSPIGDKP